MSIAPQIVELLASAFSAEYDAMLFYQQLSRKFHQIGLRGFSEFFHRQADEEAHHIETMVDYFINQRNYLPTLSLRVDPEEYPDSPVVCLKRALEKERAIAELANQIIERCEQAREKHLHDYFLNVVISDQNKAIVELNKHIYAMTSLEETGQPILWIYDKYLLTD